MPSTFPSCRSRFHIPRDEAWQRDSLCLGRVFCSHHPSRFGSWSFSDTIRGVSASSFNSISYHIALTPSHFAPQELPLFWTSQLLVPLPAGAVSGFIWSVLSLYRAPSCWTKSGWGKALSVDHVLVRPAGTFHMCMAFSKASVQQQPWTPQKRCVGKHELTVLPNQLI